MLNQISSNKLLVTILGSTGSIGCNTLLVINDQIDDYQVFALTANTAVEKLLEQCIKFRPQYAIILDKVLSIYLQNELLKLNISTQVLYNKQDLIMVSTHESVDIVMSAIVGSDGLLATYYAIKANKKILLANKESLVAAGSFMINVLSCSQGQLIPVDSEHSAIFQCLEAVKHDLTSVKKIILTASGGPFCNLDINAIKNMKAKDALQHPNWSMGQKITIDSSTLMNKGLEFIEAYWLFGQNTTLIDIIIHHQSIIHSMIEFIDGTILAQMGAANMQIPIAYALNYPDKKNTHSTRLDFSKIQQLSFGIIDFAKFPCLSLAINAIKIGGIIPTILNASNEIAVHAFLINVINFYDINYIIEYVIDNFHQALATSIDDIVAIDQEVKLFTKQFIHNRFNSSIMC